MTAIKLSKALSAFRLDDQREFDFGAFTVTLKRFTMTNPVIRATVERVQRQQRRKPAGSETDLATDIELFCRISLVSWTLKDDAGKAVPIDQAKEVFLGSKEGNELYFNLIQLAKSDDAFEVDDGATDEAEAKN